MKETCPECGHTLFKKSGRGFKKPFCINPECPNFLPEDQRGYKKKAASAESRQRAPLPRRRRSRPKGGGQKDRRQKAGREDGAAKKTAAPKKTAAKKPTAKKAAAKTKARRGRLPPVEAVRDSP